MIESDKILLERFEEYMDDSDAFYAIYDFLPTSYQYQLILNLLEVENNLIQGDTRRGTYTQGLIIIEDFSIVCYDKTDNKHVLTALPKSFDI